MTGTWHTQPERGTTLGMRISVWLYRRFGRGVARLLLHPIVSYFFVTTPAARRASRHWLERAFATPEGAKALGRAPGTGTVYRHYREFGMNVFDRAGFWLGRKGDFNLMEHGRQHLDRLARDKCGAVILGSHLGSFDVMRLLAVEHAQIPVNVLMYTRHAARINTLFDALLIESGGGGFVRIVQIDPGSFQHVFDARAAITRGEVVAILADRPPPSETRKVCSVEFVGGRLPIPQGPFRLAALLGCPVLLMFALRTGERAYSIHVEPFAERLDPRETRDPERLQACCQRYADRLAAYALSAPLQWFNFFEVRDDGARG
jgi:predicted LPLAT superfamily acyltransferase